MKRLLMFVPLICLSGLLTVACERGVRADREGPDTYQPRPAPAADPTAKEKGEEISGELTKIELKGKAITVRASNGMDQTFRFDDQTKVEWPGLRVGDLKGMEGSELLVSWRDETGTKMATHIEVKDPPTESSAWRKSHRRR